MADPTPNRPDVSAELGQLALSEGLINPKQLGKAEAVRGASGGALGDVLLSLGYLDQARLDVLQQKLLEGDPRRFAARRDVLLGRQIVHRGLVSAEAVEDAFRGLAMAGGDLGIGQFLVSKGLMTQAQLARLTARPVVPMVCAACPQHYDVTGYESGYRIKCLKCGQVLEEAQAGGDRGQPMPMYFDKDKADEIKAFARRVLGPNHCTKEQLGKALEIQAMNKADEAVGEILVVLGYLDPAVLATIQAQEQAQEAAQLASLRAACKGQSLGAILVQMGYITAAELEAARSAQAAQTGEPRLRVGQILVNAGLLTLPQVVQALDWQGRDLLRCPAENTQYNAVKGQTWHCPSCRQPLVPVTSLTHVAVEGDLPGEAARLMSATASAAPAPPPAPDEAPLSRNETAQIVRAAPADIELGGAPSGREPANHPQWKGGPPGIGAAGSAAAPVEAGEADLSQQLEAAGSKMQDLYAKIDPKRGAGTLEAQAAAAARIDPSGQIDIRSARDAARGTAAFKGRQLGNPFMTLVKWSAGAMVLLIAVITPFLFRELPDPRKAETPPPTAEQMGLLTPDKLQPGEPVTVFGEVPWGPEYLDLGTSGTGYYLMAPDGTFFWIVDPTGANRRAMSTRTFEDSKQQRFLVRVEGVVIRADEAAVEPKEASGVTLARVIRLETWARIHLLPGKAEYLMRRTVASGGK